VPEKFPMLQEGSRPIKMEMKKDTTSDATSIGSM
jgi:hypothetical protein